MKKSWTVLALLGLAACETTPEPAVTATGNVPWSYTGPAGPANWASLSSAYAACAGPAQSPVDIETGETLAAAIGPVEVDYAPFAPTVVNLGKTLQVNAPEGAGRVTLDGTVYRLLQFHFHHASEHTVDGTPSPMEVHFVNQAEDGGLLVLGALIERGAENPALAPVWAAIPAAAGGEVTLGETIDPTALLPASAGSFRYQGSLTTPPCSEVVTWNVFGEPVEASAEQIAAFEGLFPASARPVQPLNRRYLLTNAAGAF